MFTLSHGETINYLNERQNKSNLSPYNITILSNIVVNALEPYLSYLLGAIKLEGKYQYGDHDNVLQECLKQTSSILNEKTNCILVFLNLENFSQVLTHGFSISLKKEISQEIKRITQYLKNCLMGIRQKTQCPVLLHGFENISHPNYGIYDSKLATGQNTIIHELNHSVKNILEDFKDVYFVDMNLCVLRIGTKAFYDKRYKYLFQAPFSIQALQEIANEDYKYIAAIEGHSKKCVVLDCDNILWGGIIGEDGLSNINISNDYPGSMFREFQQAILNLYHRGIIIALCSKNNEMDIWEVFNNHPNMVLKYEHISAYAINWENKAFNIQKISKQLNISTDSMVFIDDSDFEINLINHALPEVATIHMPIQEAHLNTEKLQICGYFNQINLSNEDKARGKMYAENLKRKLAQPEHINLTDYYADLEMEISIKLALPTQVVRLSQLTQKTNQFNLTTRRYSESKMHEFISSDQNKVIYAELRDKFGNFGIIALTILQYQSTSEVDIDTFLLSCRALGRGVEVVLLHSCIELFKAQEIKTAFATYKATNKNVQCSGFYQEHGFVTARNINNDEIQLKLNVPDSVPAFPNYYKKIMRDILQ